MRIACIQADLAWEDHETNRRRLAERLWGAAAAGAQLVLLPEMFPTGFSMNAEETAEEPDGESVRWLQDQASTHGLVIAGSIAMRTPGFERPTNTLVVAGPDGELGRYHKIQTFSYVGESEHFSAGTETLTIPLTTSGGAVVRTTFFVCFDLRFADLFWDTAADTDLYVVVANWPRARRRHWETLLRARAIENQAYVAAVNRVGEAGDGLEHAGDSAIIDPLGYPLATGAMTDTMVLADVDPATVADVRARFPFMDDRRS